MGVKGNLSRLAQDLLLRDEIDRLSTFILAGGKGKRLYPLTKDRAKPAVVFGGMYRIIDFTLSNCINSGIRRINVLTQYKSVSLARHIKLGWNFLPSELTEFIEVIPAQQRYGEFWYRGTADSIYQNIYTLEREDCDRVLILAGDHIYKMDYLKMLQFHLDKGADVTVGVVEMPRRDSQQYGVLEVDRDGRVLSFEEKPLDGPPMPDQPDRVYASMGIYLFNRGVLFEELVAAQAEEKHDFGRDILPNMVETRQLFAYPFVDEDPTQRPGPYWRDVGTLDALYEANIDLIEVEPHFNLYGQEWPIRTYQRQFPPAKTVHSEAQEGQRRGEALESLICGGCIVSGAVVRRSILSPEVRIHSYARVDDSVLMDQVEVGRHARVRRAIIDKYVQILPGTEIGFDLESDRKRFTVTESGVVVVPKARVVGPAEDSPRWAGRFDAPNG